MLTVSLNAVRATYRFLSRRPARAGARRPVPTLRELCFALLFVGATGFGGWLQARLFHLAVLDKGWLSEEEFVELTVTASLAPGGNSSNLGAEIGRYLLGPAGMVVAYFSLLLPGTVMMLVLGSLYSTYHAHPLVRGALAGMESAAVALICLAVVRLRPAALSGAEALVAGLACLAILCHLPAPVVILLSGLAVFALQRRRARSHV